MDQKERQVRDLLLNASPEQIVWLIERIKSKGLLEEPLKILETLKD